MPETPIFQFPYPADGDLADGPAAFQALAEATEERLYFERGAVGGVYITGPQAAIATYATSSQLVLPNALAGTYMALVNGSFQFTTAGGTAWVSLDTGVTVAPGKLVASFPAMATAPIVPFSSHLFFLHNGQGDITVSLKYGNGTGPVSLYSDSSRLSVIRVNSWTS